jgi:two-component system, cell cycle sensor histidine kinase and response regulator CckA
LHEVSCTATAVALDALAHMGVAAEEVVDGLPVGLDWLRDRRRRIGWNTFARFMDNTGERVGVDGLQQMGALMLDTPSFRYLRTLGSLLITPRQAYELNDSLFGPALFPILGHSLEKLPGGRLRQTLEVPAGYQASEAYFWTVAGCLRTVPRLFDLPDAGIDVHLEGHRAHFTLTLPEMGVRERVHRLTQLVRRPGAVLRRLAEQRRARSDSHAALARFRHDFHRVIERLPDGVVILRGGRVRYVNRALVNALGYQRIDEVVGRPVTHFVPESERKRLSELFVQHQGDDPRVPAPEELRMLRGDGRTVVFEVRPVQRISLEDERSDLLVVRDVTDRTRLQQQLMLADRMASLGTLAAGVAHEVNNPLAYTHISLQTLRRAVDGITAGAPVDADTLGLMHEALGAAEHGVERVRTIVGDLRTFSRPDDEVIRPVDVHRVIESAVSMANNELRHRAVLERDYGDVPPVMANDARLGQVFLNLLVNAAQAFVEDDRRTNHIRIRTLAEPGAGVTVEVEDNGPGIPPDILEHVFVPFVTTKPSGVGTGLGLSICHRIVTRLGGRIGVESTPGGGTMVRVVLPAATASEAPADGPVPVAGPNPRRGRILIIDDEQVLLSTLSHLLSASHEVVTAEGGSQALEVLERDDAFDLILCDLMMAEVNGAQVYERLRAMRPGLERRIVFMTGGAYTGSTRKFLADLDNPCLDKPFNLEDVLGLVQKNMTAS